MGTTDEERTEMSSVPLCHDTSALVQEAKSNIKCWRQRVRVWALRGATLVIIKEIIEITEGKKEEEVLEKVTTSKK